MKRKINELFAEAFGIGNEREYDVYITDKCREERLEHWTYIQLGMYLLQQHDNIKSVHILEKIE